MNTETAMNRATKRATCLNCKRERRPDQIEADGVCELCHISGIDSTLVGTEFDLDVATALAWASAPAQRAPVASNDVTAPMRAVAR